MTETTQFKKNRIWKSALRDPLEDGPFHFFFAAAAFSAYRQLGRLKCVQLRDCINYQSIDQYGCEPVTSYT